jgi:transcriptional regulator with XRE-family HTH domain
MIRINSDTYNPIQLGSLVLKSQRITQREVAQAAGVSQATVSMILGGGKAAAELPAETYEKVVSAARKLGYVPNRSAQVLKMNRTMTLACVMPDVSNPFYSSLARGAQSAADAVGYDVIAINTDGSAAGELRFLDWSLRGGLPELSASFFPPRAGLALAHGHRVGPQGDRRRAARQRTALWRRLRCRGVSHADRLSATRLDQRRRVAQNLLSFRRAVERRRHAPIRLHPCGNPRR